MEERIQLANSSIQRNLARLSNFQSLTDYRFGDPALLIAQTVAFDDYTNLTDSHCDTLLKNLYAIGNLTKGYFTDDA